MTREEILRQIRNENLLMWKYQRQLRRATGDEEIHRLIQLIKKQRSALSALKDELELRKRLQHATNGY